MPLPKAPTKPATILVPVPTDPARLERIPQEPEARGPEIPAARPSPATRLAVVESKPRNGGRKARTTETPKLFVLDTNVLLHDPSSAFRFEEHDIFLPMMTLEELDAHKKGMSEVARSARQVSRTLDALVASCKTPIEDGIPLDALGNKDAAGRLFFQTTAAEASLPASLPAGKADNQILGVVRTLEDRQTDRDVVR